MLKLGISVNEVDIAIQDGATDELTAIYLSEILRSGIRNVKITIMEKCQDRNVQYSTEGWRKVWKYFVKTWIKRFKPKDWNVYGVDEDIVNRTNNPPERYNRTLNRAMGEANADIDKFAVVLEREGQKFVDTFTDVANRRVRTPRLVRPRLTLIAIEKDEESASDVEEGHRYQRSTRFCTQQRSKLYISYNTATFVPIVVALYLLRFSIAMFVSTKSAIKTRKNKVQTPFGKM
ncbi:unnamed protein product [Phytophthora fragariaefolia]|uniref:Unnamed protein product n=1 Tax=Phytophthora fragariaefolia TaxID=1490495 RepID=A0A9W6YLY8_9STRA|nr:unnamed protein product [Phytophthora fragariaefolia]